MATDKPDHDQHFRGIFDLSFDSIKSKLHSVNEIKVYISHVTVLKCWHYPVLMGLILFTQWKRKSMFDEEFVFRHLWKAILIIRRNPLSVVHVSGVCRGGRRRNFCMKQTMRKSILWNQPYYWNFFLEVEDSGELKKGGGEKRGEERG